MQFPHDAQLIARGKYSMLSYERKKQIERVHTACHTLMSATQQALKDIQERPPANSEPITVIDKCLTNIKAAREDVAHLCAEMAALHDEAFGE